MTPSGHNASNNSGANSINSIPNSAFHNNSNTAAIVGTTEHEFYPQDHLRDINANNVVRGSYNYNSNHDMSRFVANSLRPDNNIVSMNNNMMNGDLDHFVTSSSGINYDITGTMYNNGSHMNRSFGMNNDIGGMGYYNVNMVEDRVFDGYAGTNDKVGRASYNNVNNAHIDPLVIGSPGMNNGIFDSTGYDNVINIADGLTNGSSGMNNGIVVSTNGIAASNGYDNVNNIADGLVNGSSGSNNDNVGRTGNNAISTMDLEWNSEFPPGYKFEPKDEELICYYLLKKINNKKLPHDGIKYVHLYSSTPEKLAENYKPMGYNAWYFFTPRKRKYKNGGRPDRAAGTGYWKATGAEKNIYHPHNQNQIIGHRTNLVFHDGRPDEPKTKTKTNWMMIEYKLEKTSSRKRLHPGDMRLDDCVLCKIYNSGYKKVNADNEQEPNTV